MRNMTPSQMRLHWASKLVALSVIFVLVIIVLALKDNQQETNSALSRAQTAEIIAKSNRNITDAIQENRVNFIRERCLNQNKRNRDTIRTLNNLLKKLPPGERRDRAKQNRPGTILLINALAPVRDCKKISEMARVS